MGARRQCQERERDERHETSATKRACAIGGLDHYLLRFTLHIDPLYKLPNLFCRDARVATVGVPILYFEHLSLLGNAPVCVLDFRPTPETRPRAPCSIGHTLLAQQLFLRCR